MARAGSCTPRAAAKIRSADKTQWNFLTTKIDTMIISPKRRGAIGTGSTTGLILLIKSE